MRKRFAFIKQNRGLSDVVTTVLIVLIALAAVAIVGSVVINNINKSGEKVAAYGECLTLEVNPTICTYDSINQKLVSVSVERGTANADTQLSNISLLFDFGSGSNEVVYPFEASNLPQALQTKSITTTLAGTAPLKVSAVASVNVGGKVSQCTTPSSKIGCVSGSVSGGVLSMTRNGTVFSNDNRIGDAGVIWNNPDNAQTSNNVFASINNLDSKTTNYLKANDFKFNMPSTSVIIGIEVRIQRKAVASNPAIVNTVKDDRVILFNNLDNPVGIDKASTSFWSDTLQYETYGGSTDKWGLFLTGADIIDPKFGVAISARENSVDVTDISIDHIEMKIYYQ